MNKHQQAERALTLLGDMIRVLQITPRRLQTPQLMAEYLTYVEQGVRTLNEWHAILAQEVENDLKERTPKHTQPVSYRHLTLPTKA